MPRTAAVLTAPPPAGAVARPPRRQRVKVPLRLITTPQYADVAVSVYVKIAALGSRPEGCTAATATIAEYLGLSKASVERGMTQLRQPGPDGVAELSSTRRSLPGGCGTSALRRTRPLTSTERFVWVPVAAAEDLTPRQLRAYALIAYAQVQRIPLTESEIAGALHHHSGRRAGQPLTTAAAGEIVDELEATRWVTVERRAGARGRHRFIAHDIPPAAQATAACGQPVSDIAGAPVTSGSSEGSGSSADAGSLATTEEPRTDRPDDERASSSPAVGEVQVSKGVENPALQSPDTAGKDGLALRADGNQPPLTSPSRYAGPELTISARIHAVLEPVHGLFRQTSVYVQRRIAREVGRQLRSGIDDARLRHRLSSRFARTMIHEIKDPGRWLLGVALPRWGCGIFDCEAGILWSSGRRCSVCEEIVQDWLRADAPPPETAPRPASAHGAAVAAPPAAPGIPRGQCRWCGCLVLGISRAAEDGLCRLCREEQMESSTPPMPMPAGMPEVCIGWGVARCTRPALGTTSLCVRCRSRQIECAAS
ncbi:hypothetical protein [Streptomyces rhizosphaericus]|uniref:hypothetical protein n=1 Tax=Streptomyces rhizosphaericus TaxID=114699 RepID=UPI001FCA4159|nr:hypothetical protein [Streptomyces rhizosphaericus]